MSLTVVDRRGRTIAALTPGFLVVASVEIAAVVLMASAVVVAAPGAPLWPAALFIAVAAVAATSPDSTAGAIALVGYGGWWLAVVEAPAWPLVVAAALAALAFHLSLAHAAAAPSGASAPLAVVPGLVLEATVGGVVAAVLAIFVSAINGASVTTPAALIGVTLLVIALIPRSASTTSPPQ